MTLKIVFSGAFSACLFGLAIGASAQCSRSVLKMAGPRAVMLRPTTSTTGLVERNANILAPIIPSDSLSVQVDEDLPHGLFIGFYPDSTKAVIVDKSLGRFELTQFYHDGSIKHALLKAGKGKKAVFDEKEFFRSGELERAYLNCDTVSVGQEFNDIGDTIKYLVDRLQKRKGLIALDIQTGCGHSTRTEFHRLNRKKVLYRRYENEVLTSFGTVPYEKELWVLLWSISDLPSFFSH